MSLPTLVFVVAPLVILAGIGLKRIYKEGSDAYELDEYRKGGNGDL